jgi:hypothetical protein
LDVMLCDSQPITVVMECCDDCERLCRVNLVRGAAAIEVCDIESVRVDVTTVAVCHTFEPVSTRGATFFIAMALVDTLFQA